MKTKNRTFLAIFILAVMVITNINAKADNKIELVNAETIEAEESNVIENWMYTESYWATKTETFIQETDKKLRIAEWMIQEDAWKSESVNSNSEADKNIELESWMTDSKLWN